VDIIGAAAIALLFSLLGYLIFRNGSSADLMAIYLAGQQFAAGNLDQIYPTNQTVFDLSYPDIWRDLAAKQGLGDMQLFPFIYPPLWAALAAKLTAIASAQDFFNAASILNPLFLCLSAVLGWFIAKPKMNLPVWTILALLIVTLSPIGFIALHQSQPQVFVSFLILLAIERSRANNHMTAGLALALAASIKIYPVLFVLIWIARRDWMPVKYFAGFGLALGIASLATGGIELHVTFLKQIKTISDTVLLTKLTFNFDTLLGQILLGGQFTPLMPPSPLLETTTGFYAPKPAVFGNLMKLATFVALILVFQQARHAERHRLYQSVWPAALILIPIFSPLAWSYHFLTAAMFFPILLQDWRRNVHAWIAASAFLSVNIFVFFKLSAAEGDVYVTQIVGTLAMAVVAVLFLIRRTKS